ncbi:ABC transporter ATP-binding protein [Aequorivita echinoideorum]|uniref:ATP-binding cassette domain-containing protein n=1 Tax=Aequorivita echinoideorum TaxID=1549647 RepID=A0ABS5S2D8_9FLAO|nr:ATP-binding cassette domain-containing protein [Aequorivita echinoideorum]MBT0607372.1 ATP-binding cassette domain-containing protein [Aequorivita echinoideorum]
MLITKNISFQYSTKDSLLKFPDITLSDNDNAVILGKSGVGKTTLLHIIAGLLRPKTGSVFFNDITIEKLSSKEKDQFIGQNIGMVFQKSYAVKTLNVVENLQARLYFAKEKNQKTLTYSLLEQLNLERCAKHKISELSEGQLQRLGIAMAVVHQPKLILADEPTSSLDDENCEAVMQLLLQQAKQNHANLLVITHDQRVKPLFQNVMAL